MKATTVLLLSAAITFGLAGCGRGGVVCDAPKLSCDGKTCINPDTDPLNCGACATACATGQSCVSGKCLCPVGSTACGSSCLNLLSDPKNCGACGSACRSDQACLTGKCDCAPGLTVCSGACVALGSDAKHCGACGNACPTSQLCSAGKCVTDCRTPLTICGSACVDLAANDQHCGTCGKACAFDRSCSGSKCLCNAGRTECAGACKDTQSDFQNCGGCGKACAQGQTCSAGRCTSAVFATCFNSGELVGLDDTLVAAAASTTVGQGPQSMAVFGEKLLVGDGTDNALYTFDVSSAIPKKEAGGDKLGKAFNQVLVKGTRAYAINSTDHNVQVIDLGKTRPSPVDASRTADQIPTKAGSPPSELNTNPYFETVIGDRLYVTLLGTCTDAGHAAGNRLLEIDVSVTPAKLLRELAFVASDYEKDAAIAKSSPRPAGLASIGKKLYVAVGNLKPDCFGSAGPGYVAVVDTSAATLSAKNIKLPKECRNPGFVATAGSRVFVSCAGSYGYGAGVEEALVVLESFNDSVVRTTTFPRCGPNDPFDGPAACKTAVPGRLAVRGQRVYVADNNAGRLFAVDLGGNIVSAKEGVKICPLKCDSSGKNCSQFTSDVLAIP
jgi:DNA-binding beta-propeller fold protein YncE